MSRISVAVLLTAFAAMAGAEDNIVPCKGHDLPRLRGVMHGPSFEEQNFYDLSLRWKANQIRWQLNYIDKTDRDERAQDPAAYEAALRETLAECDKAVEACDRFGILILVDLHMAPGGRGDNGRCRLFDDKQWQDKYLEVWERIARRYQGERAVYAYDLLNECVQGDVAEGLMDWPALATEAIKRIRAIDPKKPVVFEPGPWGLPDGFTTLKPLEADNVIYSFHMYQPHKFTHQGVRENPYGLVYPGEIQGQYWDKEQLRRTMQPARDFQQAHNVHMYIGEFSAIRWAPDNSAYRYLRDCIELFEEYGWDWSYHSFREWVGWSVEHSTDRNDWKPAPLPTDRQKLLLSYFERNQRPWLPSLVATPRRK